MPRELFVLEVDAWTVGDTTKFHKIGTPITVLDQVGKTGRASEVELVTAKQRTDDFTVYCDEDEEFGGDSAAPWPLDYFLLGVGF